jgi:hypothetical protein
MSAKEAYDQKIEKGLRRPIVGKAQAKSYTSQAAVELFIQAPACVWERARK